MPSGYPSGRTRRGKVHTAVQACRDCQAPMRWASNANGTRIPLDVNPDNERGDNILIQTDGGWTLVVQIRDSELLEEARRIANAPANAEGIPRELRRLYTAHWATCPKGRRRPHRRDLDD